MSLILDALHRSRQDATPVPGLATHHPVEHVPVERRQFLVWVLLAVALVVIAWLVVERFSAPPAADIGAPVAELSNNIGSAVNSISTELKARAAAQAPPQAEVAQGLPATATATPQPAPAVAAATSPAVTQEPAPVAEAAVTQDATLAPATAATDAAAASPEATASVAPTAPAQDFSAQPPPVSEADTEAIAELYQNRELQKDPVMPKVRADSRTGQGSTRDVAALNDEQSVKLDQILQQAREELENASLDDHSVPFLSDLSQQTKDDIPTLYYQRHDYSSDPNVSAVVLNGETLKVGGSPLPGMKIEEILPDSVVLNYRGTQFRLRALNSWINL